MEKFLQNNELTYKDNDLLKKSAFTSAVYDNAPIPKFEESKERLPQPIWENHPDYINCYWRAWEIAFGNIFAPTKENGFIKNYIDTAFNGCIFMWDSAFMLMFGKYADRIFKFQETFDNFFCKQHKDGFICREIEESNGRDTFVRHDPSSTGPEVMSWCEWDYYLNFGDKKRLEKVFPCLLAYHQWMKEHFTWRDGTYFSSGWGCGMDNLPRMDKKYHESFGNGHLIWIDACAQELNACNILIEMAKILGKNKFIPELEKERDLLNKAINEKLWDEKTGFYYDLQRDNQFNMVKHIGAFWCLLAKCVPADRAEKFIAHLNNENEFKTPHRVPALSKDHPEFTSTGGYWKGGIWAPTNYMVLKGLDAYEKFDISHEIACNHLEWVVDVFKRKNTVFENYAPEKHHGKCKHGKPSRADFVGWTGLSPISIMFEYVFGIKPNAKENKISWHINLLDRHGIEKYPFGKNGELTLICEKRASQNEKPVVTIESNIPVTLEILWNGNKEIIVKD